jgi:hypothetical protein
MVGTLSIRGNISTVDESLQRLRQDNQIFQSGQSSKLDEINHGLRSLRLDIQSPSGKEVPIILQPTSEMVDVIQGITSRLERLVSDHKNLSTQAAILSSLKFESRLARHEAVSEAHARTFRVDLRFRLV